VRQSLFADSITLDGSDLQTAIYRDIEAAAAAVAVVVSNTPIYRLTLAAAATITNDLSGIEFSGDKVAEWEVWVDLTTTNALDSTFAADMDFGGSPPELTVTGVYQFACASLSGSKVEARQIYPTVHSKTRYPTSATTSSLLAATDSAVLAAPAGAFGQYYFMRVLVKSSSGDGATYGIYTPAYSKNGQTAQENVKTFTLSGSSGATFAMDRFTLTDFLYNVSANMYGWGLAKTGSDNTSTPRFVFDVRLANELEIKAYEAGWRP